jgi:hypothetical protein
MKFASAALPDGTEFQKSFVPIGMITSLVNGMPRRDICIHAPLLPGAAPVSLNVVNAGRDAEAQTPIT